MDKAEISCSVKRDEDKVPESMTWYATEGNADGRECEAAFFSFWSQKDNNSYHLNLWSKDMTQEAMKRLTLNSLVTLADALKSATTEQELANDLQEFADFFATKAKLTPDEE